MHIQQIINQPIQALFQTSQQVLNDNQYTNIQADAAFNSIRASRHNQSFKITFHLVDDTHTKVMIDGSSADIIRTYTTAMNFPQVKLPTADTSTPQGFLNSPSTDADGKNTIAKWLKGFGVAYLILSLIGSLFYMSDSFILGITILFISGLFGLLIIGAGEIIIIQQETLNILKKQSHK